MKVLIIKQTSLGDVLHATGHIRVIKETFPGCEITLLTAKASHDLFRHNPHIDEFVLFEKDKVRRQWKQYPWWTVGHILGVIRRIRQSHYDLALDLQGRARSVIFLYTANARAKYVKGRWLGLKRYHNPEIHAIKEMDELLTSAGITVTNSAMEVFTSAAEQQSVAALLARINPRNKKVVIISPFTRWATKNWDPDKFTAVALSIAPDAVVAFTGAADKREEIGRLIDNSGSRSIVNVAGELSLLEFAEFIKHADLVITGDSFPMHLASAVHTPLIALFGPTDENRVGPVGRHFTVVRAESCLRCCRRKHCQRNCMTSIDAETVIAEARQWLAMAAPSTGSTGSTGTQLAAPRA